MIKIEPMTIEEIKRDLQWALTSLDTTWQKHFLRVVLTWVEAEARAEKAEFWNTFYESMMDGSDKLDDSHKQYLTDQDWLAEVLREIGWPEDQT